MSFLDKLRKVFIYTGEDSNPNIIHTNKGINGNILDGVRKDIGNPIKRMKDFKDEVSNNINNTTIKSNKTLTQYTKNLMYSYYYTESEKILNKGKNKVETFLLYKSFLEDMIVDEDSYSDEDIRYIKVLNRIVNETPKQEDIKDSLLEDIKSNLNFLSMVEYLDVTFGYKILNELCTKSYLIGGYYYTNNEPTFVYTNPNLFSMEVNGITFLLLKEIESVITNDDLTLTKLKYINSKLSPLFSKVINDSTVYLEHLYKAYCIFNTPIIEEENKPTFQSNLYNTMNSIVEEYVEVPQPLVVPSSFPSDEMDNNPITKLKIESENLFDTKYAKLCMDVDVTQLELKNALKEINDDVEHGVELTPEQYRIYVSIKSRIKD